jgi:D-allose transport system substrate-binding protein
MKKSKWLVLVMAMALAVSVFAGCQANTPAASAETSENASSVAPASPAASSENPAKPPKVAFVLKTLANEYWAGVNDGILQRAKEVGMDAVIFAVESESDAQGQLKKFEDALSQDFDVIAFSPISPANLNTAIVAANKAGIPVVNIDDLADLDDLKNQGGYLDSFVSADNVLMGRLSAEELVKALGDAGGEVAIIEGIPGVMASEHRKKGAQEAFAKNPKIQIVSEQPGDWDRVKALDVATNVMQSHPNIKAIFCANDTMAMGAYEAVVNAGKAGQVFVSGNDGNPEAIESIGKGGMTATVLQDTIITGAACVDAALELVKNGGTKGGEMKTVYVDLIMINKDNASKFIK